MTPPTQACLRGPTDGHLPLQNDGGVGRFEDGAAGSSSGNRARPSSQTNDESGVTVTSQPARRRRPRRRPLCLALGHARATTRCGGWHRRRPVRSARTARRRPRHGDHIRPAVAQCDRGQAAGQDLYEHVGQRRRSARQLGLEAAEDGRAFEMTAENHWPTVEAGRHLPLDAVDGIDRVEAMVEPTPRRRAGHRGPRRRRRGRSAMSGVDAEPSGLFAEYHVGDVRLGVGALGSDAQERLAGVGQHLEHRLRALFRRSAARRRCARGGQRDRRPTGRPRRTPLGWWVELMGRHAWSCHQESGRRQDGHGAEDQPGARRPAEHRTDDSTERAIERAIVMVAPRRRRTPRVRPASHGQGGEALDPYRSTGASSWRGWVCWARPSACSDRLALGTVQRVGVQIEPISMVLAELARDTFNGLSAFVVPGADPYSVAQGVQTTGAGRSRRNNPDVPARHRRLLRALARRLRPGDRVGAAHRVGGHRVPDPARAARAGARPRPPGRRRDRVAAAQRRSHPALARVRDDDELLRHAREPAGGQRRVPVAVRPAHVRREGAGVGDVREADPDLVAIDRRQPARAADRDGVGRAALRRPARCSSSPPSAPTASTRRSTRRRASSPARPVGWPITSYQPNGRSRAGTSSWATAKDRKEADRLMARDVIIIGAGGGGPVVAKELAARGLDVLLLEAGPVLRRPREGVDALRERRQQRARPATSASGPPTASKPAWLRETPQNSLIWQLSGVGGTTQHYYGNNPRAAPGAFMGYDGADKAQLRHRAPVPVHVPRADPVLRVDGAHAAGADRGDGHQGGDLVFRGAERLGLPVPDEQGHHASRRSARRRTRSSSRAATRGRPPTPAKLSLPARPRAARSAATASRAASSRDRRRATSRPSARPTTATCRWRSPPTSGRRAARPITLVTDAFVTRINTADRGRRRSSPRRVTWRVGATGETHTEDAKVIVMAGGCTEDPRLWLNSDLPEPERLGRPRLHRSLLRLGHRRHARSTPATSKGVGSSARADYPGYGGLENVGLPPALQAFASTFSDAGMRGGYTQRPRRARARGTATAGRLHRQRAARGARATSTGCSTCS